MAHPQQTGTPPGNPIHATAVAAWHAGLCPLPTAADGTKRPLGQWKRYQAARPTLEQVDAWFTAGGHHGWGTLCGTVAGNLEMLEIEGRAYDEGLWAEFQHRCDAAGMGEVLDRVIEGYGETTPSGGIHLLFRTEGPALGNQKLAQRDSTPEELAIAPQARVQTLVETRGEGGFVILAPSGGPTHPSGHPWVLGTGGLDTIATITTAERDGLYHVARTLNTASSAPEVATMPAQPLQVAPVAADGERWIDSLCRDLASRPWGDILARYGFAHHHDAGQVTYWTRPGKDTSDGYSATTNAKGTDRLIVFSSSMPLPPWSGTGPAPSYDRLDVIAAFEHGGDRMAAARALAGRTTGATSPSRPFAALLGTPVADDGTEPVSGLDEAFWTARESLEHIRQAARARLVAPAAVLGAVLARVAAFTPPSTCIPAIIGSTAPLSLFVAFHGASGAGKSAPMSCAGDLLPTVPAGCVGPLGVGSGEGLVEAYMELVEEEDGGGKKRRVKRQVHRGALFTLDEGQMLGELSSRKGATILPVLRTAWSGGDPGQANASIETRRTLRPGSYALGLISLWQDKAAAALLDDADGGTPQRFVWLPTIDPEATADRPPWPGSLHWAPPPLMMMSGTVVHAPLDVHPEIVDEITAARVAALRGEAIDSPLDAHRRLNKLKVAGVLAVLDDRHDIDLDDWRLAECILSTSDRVRDWVLAEARRNREAAVMAAAVRQATVAEVAESRAAEKAIETMARAIARAAQKAAPGALKRRDFHAATTSKHRALASLDEAIARAEQAGWIVAAGAEWTAGKSVPA